MTWVVNLCYKITSRPGRYDAPDSPNRSLAGICATSNAES